MFSKDTVGHYQLLKSICLNISSRKKIILAKTAEIHKKKINSSVLKPISKPLKKLLR